MMNMKGVLNISASQVPGATRAIFEYFLATFIERSCNLFVELGKSICITAKLVRYNLSMAEHN
jgi:hypothetical protein